MRNANGQLDVPSLLDLKIREIGDFCDDALDASTLIEELEHHAPFPLSSRKGFCEFLGVGESTLAGWLKEERMPRMAKEAYILTIAFEELRKEVKRLKQEADDIKIIKDGEKYTLVRFELSKGSIIGQVVARDIPNAKTARVLAASIASFRLLQETKGVINEMLERTENPSYISWLEQLRMQITKQTLTVFDPDRFLEVYETPLNIEDEIDLLIRDEIGRDDSVVNKETPSSNDATNAKD